MTQLLFSLSLFLSASLLFVIQPMVAKSLLPVYGGTPAVWTVCMLFFQALLLVSYGYAWLLSRFRRNWCWRLIHLVTVIASLALLPLGFSSSKSSAVPDIAILKDLLFQTGLPLLVIASSAPLLQFIYSRTHAKKAHDPYFLYVASNIGSLLALLSYPWLIEQASGLNLQFYYWNYVFLAYLVLLAGIIFMVPLANAPASKAENTPIALSMMLRWIGYSFIPCSLMLGVTFYITTDIAATPLFWIVPLVLYLLTFILTFAQKPLISHAWVTRNSLCFIVFPVLGFIVGTNVLFIWQLIIFNVLTFFILALLCHGELVKIRPRASQLTSFYLCLATGGVLAGLLNAIVAPRFFNGAYEYPLVLALAAFCIPLSTKFTFNRVPVSVLLLLLLNYYLPDYSGLMWIKSAHALELLALILIVCWPKTRINLLVSLTILLVFLFSPCFKANPVVSQQRNFYGVKQILFKKGVHALVSQNTLHGFQLLDKGNRTNGGVAYYGPMDSVVKHLQTMHRSLRVSILGLGTGIMACQFRPSDKVGMIEIDEQIIDIAHNPHFFTYLRDCPPALTIARSDGRLALQTEKNASIELVVVDAFSSDAIPTHLITQEAVELYRQKLTQDGVLLINTSNRHIQLLPMITALGHQLNLIVLHLKHAGDARRGQLPSEWIMLTANEELSMLLMREDGWRFAPFSKSAVLTDDYSNLIPLLKWSLI
ncbi:MAG: fused MFS/spermidine synthase [Legionella sp.]|nr:fused MFS/spermidine synthase [Legionella sp.]